MAGPPGNEIPASAFGVSCFVKEDGLLHCERKLLPERASRETGRSRDPQRDTRASRQDGSFQRDAAMQRALAAREAASPEGPREPSAASSGQLDYPADRAGGSLIQGSTRPPPDFGREWREASRAGASASGRGGASFEAADARERPAASVPRVPSLMYSR